VSLEVQKSCIILHRASWNGTAASWDLLYGDGRHKDGRNGPLVIGSRCTGSSWFLVYTEGASRLRNLATENLSLLRWTDC
jgi:hypothetical protein